MPHPASSRSADPPAAARPDAAGGGHARAAVRPAVPIDRVAVAAYVIPTDVPESDGTAEWDRTTLVVAHVEGGGAAGLGYTYGDLTAADVIARVLAPLVQGRDAMDVGGAWAAMGHAVRNAGRPGIAATAISAVDAGLWDLKARLLDLPLVALLGARRDRVAVYGSGGFTSAAIPQLQAQLAGWIEAGIPRVKMKVGRDAAADPERVRAAREAIGPQADLYVDANGAWAAGRAVAMAARFAEHQVSWFEEPVSSDDLDGLRHVRDRAPRAMEIAAGEYAYDAWYVRRMLAHGAVDVMQADATRCGGITGFLQIAAVCDAFGVPLSAHTAPALHAAPCCAVARVRHVEYFHDHVRIEQALFDGAPRPVDGRLAPDRGRPGLGLTLKQADASPFQVR
jgi:L-alanine-DL-glutamate epimerase-like enolase superfamily enzyme